MDTSKEYIKMCEKAGKIQNFRIYAVRGVIFKFEDGDVISHSKTSIEIFKESTPDHDCDYTIDDEHIWLPRQDQLQGMVFHKGFIGDLIKSFIDFCYDYDFHDKCYDGLKLKYEPWSMEQLWLAFVMKKKYNKTWNGKEWEVK